MSSVPKNKRKKSPFQASIDLIELRNAVTALIYMDFGYSSKIFNTHVRDYRRMHEKSSKDIDKKVDAYIKKRLEIDKWIIEEERRIIFDIMRKISSEFKLANCIYPSTQTPAGVQEYIERRTHLDNAIAYCHDLSSEFEYIMTTLPVDKNKYVNVATKIENQLRMFKGVRKADNKYLKELEKDVGNITIQHMRQYIEDYHKQDKNNG